METTIVKTENGKNYNKYGEELILCEICETQYTTALFTKLCDRCWELKTRIGDNFDIAQKIIKQREGRLESISTIEALYPVDSKYPDTREKAKEILLETILEADWRDLPEEILSLYANKCMAEENTLYKL